MKTSQILLDCARAARKAAEGYLSHKDGRVRRQAIKHIKRAEMLEAKANEFARV